MKKPRGFTALAIVVVAGARWQYSRGSASMALSSIERQSLHDAPNEEQQAPKVDLHKLGLDPANAPSVAAPPSASLGNGPVIIPAGSAQQRGQAVVTKLTAEQLQAFRALATLLYQTKGVDGKLNPGLLREHTLTITGEVKKDGSLKLETIGVIWSRPLTTGGPDGPSEGSFDTSRYNNFSIRADDGALSSTLIDAGAFGAGAVFDDPGTQKFISKNIDFWVDYARKNDLVSNSDSDSSGVQPWGHDPDSKTPGGD